MDRKPTFSIIVPVYNGEKRIRKLLDSIERQTYADYEVILMDDGSSDGTFNVLLKQEKKDARFRAIHQDNQGAFAARLNGVPYAKGEYVLFFDADDSIVPDALEVMNRKILQTGCDVLIYGMNRIENGEQVEHPDIEKEEIVTEKSDLLFRMLTSNTYNPMWRKAVKRELLRTEGYRDLLNEKYGEDLIQSLDILYDSKKTLLIPDRLYNYVLNPEGLTSSISAENYTPKYRVREYALDFINRHHLFDEAQMTKYRGYGYRLIFDQISRIIQFDAPAPKKKQLLNAIRNSDYYQSFLKGQPYDPSYLGKRSLFIRLFEMRMDPLLIAAGNLMKSRKGSHHG